MDAVGVFVVGAKAAGARAARIGGVDPNMLEGIGVVDRLEIEVAAYLQKVAKNLTRTSLPFLGWMVVEYLW